MSPELHFESRFGLCAASLSLSPPVWLREKSPAITRARPQIFRAPPDFRMALLVEAVASMLHQLSPLRDRPFFSLTPAEAEVRMAKGGSLDSLASTGVLYLSHPECFPLAMQEALLLLIRKCGCHTPRVITFARRGLRPLAMAGSFSAELANSLESPRMRVPTLRERSEDIPALLSHLIGSIAERTGAPPYQLAPDLLDATIKRTWLGNLIELRGTAESLMKHASKSLPNDVDFEAMLGPSRSQVPLMRLDDVVPRHIFTVLFTCNGDKAHAAEVLGMSRSTLYRMLKQHAN
jgi:DNA-binding NtrC family response regulator